MATLTKNKIKKVFSVGKEKSKTLVSFKVDKKIKKQFADVVDDFGIPFSTAIVIFMKKTIKEKRLVLGDDQLFPIINSRVELDKQILQSINSGFVSYEKSWLYKKDKELGLS